LATPSAGSLTAGDGNLPRALVAGASHLRAVKRPIVSGEGMVSMVDRGGDSHERADNLLVIAAVFIVISVVGYAVEARGKA
jgi:hypothetical protein